MYSSNERQNTLRVFKNRVLRETLGLKSEGKQQGDGKFSSDKINNVYKHSILFIRTEISIENDHLDNQKNYNRF